jgi:hypothetical protein
MVGYVSLLSVCIGSLSVSNILVGRQCGERDLRFPISTRRSLRHFDINFRPQQLRVITLISVGIVESMLATLEVQRSSKRFGDGSTQKERSRRFLYLANVHAN